MSNLEDDISELSTLASYHSSPGASSQILIDISGDISQIDVDDNDDRNSILLARSPSIVGIPNPPPKRKQLLPRSGGWEKPKEPLELLVQIRAIKYEKS